MSNNILFDSRENSNASSWRIVNDAVMGGLSKSEFYRSNKGYGIFKGTVSLENNGGFSMVKYCFLAKNIENFSKVKITFKGDLKKYQIRIKEVATTNYAFVKEFSSNGNWQELEFSFMDFCPTFRGKKMDLPNFNKNKIEEIAFFIGNKKEENFEFLLKKIELL